ncbi:MAG: FAD-dependent oxidoreductase [Chitinophagales bacterium]|jgi:monoamine oxidase|nr:FAD-dependent oxidoreductase [Chitinophagales bacterium]
MADKNTVLIIGAGAAGLTAARELCRKGNKVTILEARNRAGGRIETVQNDTFSTPTELGAEFIHGDLPSTMRLLKEANISYYPITGKIFQSKQGKFERQDDFIEDWKMFEKSLKKLKRDITVSDFLEKYLDEEKHKALKNSVQRFVEGYDAADISRASTFALREEWLSDDDNSQYRVKGGYKKIIDFLANESLSAGCTIHFSSVVKTINWEHGKVSIVTSKNEEYTARKVIITVPLGILQQNISSPDAIIFNPEVPKKIKAARSIGYGSVIKILLQFRTIFWQEDDFKKPAGKNLKDMGFLFSDATIPTWWTQLPLKSPLLTGWLAGPNSEKYKDSEDKIILDLAIDSLAFIFMANRDKIKDNLEGWQVANWLADPFSKGAYAYATLNTNKARKELVKPVKNTLFFAGEALYEGAEIGTAEAAFTSGLNVAEQVLKKRI